MGLGPRVLRPCALCQALYQAVYHSDCKLTTCPMPGCLSEGPECYPAGGVLTDHGLAPETSLDSSVYANYLGELLKGIRALILGDFGLVRLSKAREFVFDRNLQR